MIDNANPSVEFSVHDRCDRCLSQAYMSATRDHYELLFCLHHAKQHNLALEVDGWLLAYDYAAIEQLVPDRVPA